jgi:Arc/MetJ-type ribon-helix-helix transcriptional regulator
VRPDPSKGSGFGGEAHGARGSLGLEGIAPGIAKKIDREGEGLVPRARVSRVRAGNRSKWRWDMERKVKATVLVDADVLSQVKRLVGKGRYRSLNACVNEALRVFLDRERRVRLESEMEEASRDEMFLADIKASMEDFKYADAETARRLKRNFHATPAGCGGNHSSWLIRSELLIRPDS